MESFESLTTIDRRHAVFETHHRMPLQACCLYLTKVSGRNHPSTQTLAQQAQSRRQSPLSQLAAGPRTSYSRRQSRNVTSAGIRNPILTTRKNRWFSQLIDVKSNATVPNASLPCADASSTCRGAVITWRVLDAGYVYPDVVLTFVVPHATKLTGGGISRSRSQPQKEGRAYQTRILIG